MVTASFHCPSLQVRHKLVEAGWDQRKLLNITHGYRTLRGQTWKDHPCKFNAGRTADYPETAALLRLSEWQQRVEGPVATQYAARMARCRPPTDVKRLTLRIELVGMMPCIHRVVSLGTVLPPGRLAR